MLLSTRIKVFVVIWAAAETLAFMAVAKLLGIGGALLLGLLTTLFGAALLKRTSAAAMLRLRATLGGRRDGPPGTVLDGTLTAAAAAALLLPGFLTDALGLALSVPPVRALVLRRIARSGFGRFSSEERRRPAASAIDLDPGEWSRTATRLIGGGEITPRA